MNKIAIFGAGGFGREVLQIVKDINKLEQSWECVGFLLDTDFGSTALVQGIPVVGGIDWLKRNPEVKVVVAVGSSAKRFQITNRIKAECSNEFAILVHPRAWIGSGVEIGDGTIICAGALITTDIKIGQNVHVNIGATIGHDAILQDFTTLNPSVNISGNVTLSSGVEVGTGSVVIPGCTIGEWSIIGAGSIVTKAIKENCTSVGAPAKVIKERDSGWYKG